MDKSWCRSPLLPVALSFMIAIFVIVTQPGEIRKDALEYDEIARSLVVGDGFAIAAQPTMLREPGYPVFRAALYWIGLRTEAILVVQAVLVAIIVLIVGKTFAFITGSNSNAATWGAASAYGFSAYAASHYSEVWTGFLLAMSVWLAVCCVQKKAGYVQILLIVTGVALALTRINMILVPPLLFIFVACSLKSSRKECVRKFLVLFAVWFVLLVPWIIRNGVLFQEWNITSRSGTMLHARVQDADAPFAQWGATLLSTAIGQVAALELHLQPIVIQDKLHTTFWLKYRELTNEQGYTQLEADRILRKEALQVLLTTPHILIGYIAWTPIEILQLWSLPSLKSPNFSIEGMFFPAWRAGHITSKHIAILIAVHVLQVLMWISLALALISGFKQYRYKWIPGFLFFAATVTQVPFDVIIRYGAPVQPWMWATIGWFVSTNLSGSLRFQSWHNKLLARFFGGSGCLRP